MKRSEADWSQDLDLDKKKSPAGSQSKQLVAKRKKRDVLNLWRAKLMALT